MTRTPDDRLLREVRDLRRRVEILKRHTHAPQVVPPCDCAGAGGATYVIHGDGVDYFQQLEQTLDWDGDSVTGDATTVLPNHVGTPQAFKITGTGLYTFDAQIDLTATSASGTLEVVLAYEPVAGGYDLLLYPPAVALDSDTQSLAGSMTYSLSGSLNVTGLVWVGLAYFYSGPADGALTNEVTSVFTITEP